VQCEDATKEMALGMLQAGRWKVDLSQSGLGRVGNGRQSCEQKCHQEQEARCVSDMATRYHSAKPFAGTSRAVITCLG